jgi:hypothetical protein
MTVPTMYSKAHWAKRRLSVKELGNILDWPGDLVRLLSQQTIAGGGAAGIDSAGKNYVGDAASYRTDRAWAR